MPRDAACTVMLDGVKYLTKGTMTVLRADDLEAVNSFDYPDRVAPRETDFSPTDTKFEVSLPADSLTLLRIGTAR
jgi:alpha-L-arabinofuranosidase